MPRIIFWIVIVSFIAYSSCSPPILRGNSQSICDKNVSQKIARKTSNGFDKDQKWVAGHFLQHQRIGILPKNQYETVWLAEKICCPGYENKSGICTPQCLIKCENGYCAQPNICECDNNWGGDFCDKPLFCTVIKPACINVSEIISKNPVQDHFEDLNGNPLIGWKGLPECQPGCLEQVLPENCTRSAKMTYISFPIDSPCNAIAAHWIFCKKYSYVLGGVIGVIVLFVIVIFILCIVRKKRTTFNIMNSEVSDAEPAANSEAEYEYVDLNQVRDERPRYAQCKKPTFSIHYPQAQ